MAYEGVNQLIVKDERAYYSRRKKDGSGSYDRELEPGNYQFTTIKTLIDQFMISYVGKDKVIPTVNYLDVQYHAMRGLQEFSYDIFRSYKGFEFELPPTLSMILPQDYVAYNQVSWSDEDGIKHPIYYNSDTSDPRNPFQTDATRLDAIDNPFTVHAIGTTTATSSYVELDGLYPQLFSILHGIGTCFVKFVNPGLYDGAPGATSWKNWTVYAVFHNEATGKTSIQLNGPNDGPNVNGVAIAATVSGDMSMEFYWTDPTGTPGTPQANVYNLPPSVKAPILYDPVFDTTANKITAASAGDVADIRIGMKVSASNEYFNKDNQLVYDVDYDDGIVWLGPCEGTGNYNSTYNASNYPFQANTVVPTGSTFSAVPSVTFHDEDQLGQNAQRWNAGPHMNEESDTLKNFKSNNSNDSESTDYEIKELKGNRYGLDTQRANRNGTFYIDQNKGTMRFSSNLVGKTIVIDYISDSVGQKREQIVHKFAEEAMYKWIAYAVLSTRSNTPEYLVARFKKERFAEMRKAKLRIQNINFKEFTQIFRGKSKQIKH